MSRTRPGFIVALLIVTSTFATVSLVPGCATVSTAIAPRVADGVKRYCAEPLSERQLIRTQVNDMITPNTIKVTCAGDPQ